VRMGCARTLMISTDEYRMKHRNQPRIVVKGKSSNLELFSKSAFLLFLKDGCALSFTSKLVARNVPSNNTASENLLSFYQDNSSLEINSNITCCGCIVVDF
jgi:hypothetical protein